MNCKLCAFIKTTTIYADCIHACKYITYTPTLLHALKRHAHKFVNFANPASKRMHLSEYLVLLNITEPRKLHELSKIPKHEQKHIKSQKINHQNCMQCEYEELKKQEKARIQYLYHPIENKIPRVASLNGNKNYIYYVRKYNL